MTPGNPSPEKTMAPGEYKKNDAPAEIEEFRRSAKSPAEHEAVRFYLPPETKGSLLNFLAAFSCGLSGTVIFFLGLIVLFSGKTKKIGSSIFMTVIGALLLWAGIYAFRLMVEKKPRLIPFLNLKFGYWVLTHGILARKKINRLLYLPWKDITSLTVLKTPIAEGPGQPEYNVLRVGLEGSAYKHHISAAGLDSYEYELPGRGAGEFRSFISACEQFRPVSRQK